MLTHRVDGSGAPLVLLNGGLMTIASWEQIAAPLAAKQRVVRCDFRGQFLSPGPYPASIEEHADDVVALLDDLEIEAAHVAGASFGAEVAMVMAARAPHRVNRLTLVTATEKTTPEMRRDSSDARRLAEKAAASDSEAAKSMFRGILENTWSEAWLAQQPPGFLDARIAQAALLPPPYFAGAAALMHILESLDLTSLLASIEAPTLVLGAAEDRVFPPAHSQAIAAGIRDARLEIVPDAGHGLLIERADRVIEVLAR